MCGIAGFVTFVDGDMDRRQVLERMCDAINHRGPDSRGYYLDREAALGHCRLSIVDLSTGDQPIFNEDGTIAVIFNGEIYNFQEERAVLADRGHIFTTHSDTETIVHAYEEYGEKCLEHLQGMFAFAVWDSRKKRLFLARDRMGKKPLYYTYGRDFFIFASELKALLEHPATARKLHFPSLARYLLYEYVPAPDTIFQNIYKLDPAAFLTFERGGIKNAPYWDIPVGRRLQLDEVECERRFAELILKSVQRRLMSDVPLGVFLSGGIDSSCVVAMMAELLPPENIHTFSIGFSEDSFDESRYARAVAEYFGTRHEEEILSEKSALEILPHVAEFLDEPLGDASILPTYLLSRFTRRHVTVALGGDGGDELLAGYPTFQAHVLAEYYRKLPRYLRHSVIEPMARKLPVSLKNISLDFKAKKFLSAVDFDPYIRQHLWLGSFPPRELSGLLRPEIQDHCDLSGIYRPVTRYLENIEGGSPLEKILYLYAKLYLQDDILVKVDRASMANSLEVRAPFLDTDLVEFLAQVPVERKLHRLTPKYLLKRVLKSKLPPFIIDRPKKGFGIPVGQWLKRDLKPLALEMFARKKIEEEGLFCYPYIEKLLDEHFQGRKDNRKQLWTLLVFEMWLARYGRI